MKARNYQSELYQKAKDENVIIKLNTGSGKTFIASMLIRDYLNIETDKKIFLLVKNSSLGYQHFNSLKNYLFLTNEIGIFYGQMGNSWVDNWTKDKWSKQLSKYKIIVMTARVFLDILNHKKYSLDNVCYLIFDEVHHLSKSDDYAQISEHVVRATSDIKILGLTACLIKGIKQLKDIEFQIMELEKKLNCKVITSTDSIANEFSKNILESYIEFQVNIYSEINELFDVAINKLREIDTMFGDQTSSSESNCLIIENTFICSLKKYLSECSSVLKTLGVVPCKLIIDLFLGDLRLINTEFDEKSTLCLKEFNSHLKLINEKLETLLLNSKTLNCSEKCIKLIRFIYDLKIQSTDFKNEVSVLIFIKERIQALALNELFIKLPKINAEFGFISSMFIIGHSNTTYPKKLEMSVDKQSDILKKYRENVFNILIATNVIEEGLDIPHCNVVIKFDPPEDFRSYIQSKGRARANESQYVIFTSNKIQMESQISQYKSINNKINEILKSRIVENDCDEESDNISSETDCQYDFTPYGNDGPRITLNSASSVLNRYLGRLRCNGISETKIMYKFVLNDQNFYEAKLSLPMPSPYLDPISGKPCSNKRLAKQFSNLEACKILYKYDELDKSLLPYNRYLDETNLDVTETKKSDINQYEKYTAVKLSSSFQNFSPTPELVYLYSINFTPDVFLKLGINDISSFDKSSSIGIILEKPIHETGSFIKFPIYLVGGESMVAIKFERSLECDSCKLNLLLKCHSTLFELYSQRIRKFIQNIIFQPTHSKCSLIVTILKNYKIDFEKIKELVNKSSVIQLIDNNVNTWVGSVIRPTYLKNEFGALIITKVCSDMKATMFFPKMNMTYEQYYNKKYNIKLTAAEKELPLIKVTRLTTILSCINKEKRFQRNNRKLQRINENESYLIPSLMECISLSSSVWTQLCIFPTIHYRINQIFVLEEFAKKINFMSLTNSLSCFELNFNNCCDLSNMESHQFDSDITKFINNIFPCFTAKKCDDRTDLELFEILGDSFLKFITAKYLYHYSEVTDNEGKLTQRRSQLISNKNLFNLATLQELDKYFFYTNFNPKNNYLPPNFIQNNSLKNSIFNARELVHIKSKNLADCVEALIGSIFTNYGMNYTLEFLRWVGLNICPVEQQTFDIKASSPQLFLSETFNNVGIPNCISELESILEYQFKYKEYAVQAITHPSSIENRRYSCYQRLEFLGDSVIDFLITVYIMLEKTNLTPGKITNLRSALVNNNTFAYLSAKWGFHKFLNYFDSKMFYILPKVVEELLTNKLESSHNFLRKSEQYKVIVKVLGDIFESILGAIFVDSDYNLEIVWKIYKRLMDEPLKKFSNHIPKNKISMLYEKYPSLKCVYEIEENNNLIKLTAVFPDGKIIEKIERNKTLCKLALADELNI